MTPTDPKTDAKTDPNRYQPTPNRQVMSEMQAQVAGGTMMGGLAVGHVAHLGGALAGVLLVMALKSVPDPDAQ